MKTRKRILLFCLGLMMIMMFFHSCKSAEQKDKEQVRKSFQLLEECMNMKDQSGFRQMFNSIGSSSLNGSDIDQLFATFPSGITANPSPYDDFTVTDWIESDSYGKNICWSREITDHATGQIFGISVLECTVSQYSEDLGIIRLIIYPIEKEDAFDHWWNALEEDARPNGIILYGIE